jgi:diguanylate cyclase (GGDEF)-like protein
MNATILIVDDDATIRDSMCEFIDMSGFRSCTCSSAEQALELIKKKKIQVVITDIILPGINGLELTDRIRKSHNADVIVMTGYSADYSYEEAINKGASDFVFKPVRFEELLLRLKRVLKERRLKQERDQMLAELKKLAITDGLTELYNSRYFYSQLQLEVDRCRRYKHPLSLLLLDIDHFKAYNDTYGHIEGDKVLIRLGKVVKGELRKMDSAYRYGGEEFTVILPETRCQEAETVAQRIRKAIHAQKFLPNPEKRAHITVSIGVAEYSQSEDIAEFIQRSDRAMYISKKNGRNRVSCLYSNGTSR